MKDYDLGFFVFLYPKGNAECAEVVNSYQQHLNPECDSCRFIPKTLENYVTTLKSFSRAEWIEEFEERYIVG